MVAQGAATTGSLAIPVISTATPGAGTVALTWGAVPPPATGSVSYFVTANGGTPPGGTCGTSGSPIAATTCTVTGLSAGNNSFTVDRGVEFLHQHRTPPTTATLTSGAATKLAFSTQPTVGQNIQAKGTGTFSASVSVQDANANTVTTATNAVTLAIGTNPSAGVLACTNTGGLTVTAVSGVATFTGCSITKAGTGYTLAATSSPVLTPPVNANAFNITAGAATKLAFTTQPTVGQNIQATGTGTFSVSVSVQDANANTVTTATNAVTLAIGTNPSAGVLACTNTGGLTVNAVSGVATFTGCSITKTGTGYTLAATSSPVLTPPVNANAFNVTAGAATKLVFTTQPVGGVPPGTNFATQPKVSVEDVNGNVVTTDTGTVTLSIASGPGGASLSCSNPGFPTIAAVAGVATFTNCQISGTLIGTFTLQATRSGLTTATSIPVVIIL